MWRVAPAPLPPAPPASSPAARRAMQGNRRVSTAPELAVRRLLHAAGLRYRVDLAIVLDELQVRPDVVFTRARLCLFVDGCFWHGCADHCRIPTANRGYWEAKIERNRLRDERTTAALDRAGWRVIRAWEHEAPEAIAERVAAALAPGDDAP